LDFYRGNVLRVDLTHLTASVQATRSEWLDLYIGGKGLFLRTMWDELEPGWEALDSRTPICLVSGPFAGTSVSTCSRLLVGFLSPMTGTVLDSYVGGSFASEMKFAGYDMIVVVGRAPQPVVVVIDDDRVEFRPADPDYWGQTTSVVETRVRERLGADYRVLSIGPAGENGVPWACISTDQYHKAGRGGGGAVMGSKNLKAVAIRGSGAVTVGDARAFLTDVRRIHEEYLLVDAHMWAHTDGTPILVDPVNGAGAMPTRNFSRGEFGPAKSLNSEAFQAHRKRKRACYQCLLACRNFHVFADVSGEGPEYETIALCGSNCGIGDIDALARFNAECDELGLDTISTGAVVALAMDLTEKGAADFGLQFGGLKAYLEAPGLIARREGVGAELAEGTRGLARRYGHPELAFEVKNLELPGYDPRGSFGMGIAYATSDRGACHMRAFPVSDEILSGSLPPDSLEGKAAYNVFGQNMSSLRWTGIFCDFWFPDANQIAQLMRHVWKRPVGDQELLVVGERIWNLGRLLNLRHGITAADDRLPEALVTTPLPSGLPMGKIIGHQAFDEALSEYYRLRGWDEGGVPQNETLSRLGVDVRL
jgi:aldehyde:ferredoxin oxidoreductase